ncbi:MAG: type III-B CRISPR module RAMP protein Cmr1 [Candidatus Competibacteraceae bacterium]|nr:type III-B CRISPR module RAMP protein Cmr1 [Candidatus Competibacteraceae bacterium]MCB1803807.1 type III-B CRISPR module RAMP protein Cmr1 [Candidatus Competibacteraceae bacterium]MCB1813239.1 type III-B CRISPR module RAMP protein Cmr1 [Candidatus Competibacteraceae bacterium]
MQRIEATYRIVTPMFLGDADQKATSIRPPSVKGALRFWWRALNWSRALSETGSNAAAALRWLHAEEARLFGLAAITDSDGNQQGGQGVFLLRVSQQPTRLSPPVRGWPQNNTGSGYLGFGLFATKEEPAREGLPEGQDFSLELRFRPQTNDEDLASLREVLKVWGLLGGLGSRARRGFGSVALVTLDGVNQLSNATDYGSTIQMLLNKYERVSDLPTYTAFSRFTRFGVLGQPNSKARDAHDAAGVLYKQHRGQPSSLRGSVKIPFGLPLQSVDERNRRASPLFFHVHSLANGTSQAVVLFMPACFHPQYKAGNDIGFFTEVERFMEVCA